MAREGVINICCLVRGVNARNVLEYGLKKWYLSALEKNTHTSFDHEVLSGF